MLRPQPLIILLGYCAYILTGFINIGFVAIDDFADTLALAVPAQSRSFSSVLSSTADFRPLMSGTVLHALARIAYSLGASAPVNQIRFILITIGLFNFTLFWLTLVYFIRGSPRFVLSAIAALGLYFLAPFVFTRAMIENLAAPWLFLSAALALRACQQRSLGFLILSAASLFISLLFRVQVLSVAPVLLLVAWGMPNRWKAIAVVLASGLLFFVLTGIPDAIFRSGWHSSFFNYVNYNIHHSSEYGRTPFYSYLIVLTFLTFFPFSSSKKAYRAAWQETKKLWVLGAFFAAFVVFHSLVPHKEERFLIPILPIFLVFSSTLWLELGRWQQAGVIFLNSLLLVLTSFEISQNNVIGIARYFDTHPEIHTLVSVDKSVVFLPKAFSRNPIEVEESTLASAEKDVACSKVFCVTREQAERVPGHWIHLASFRPGPLEALLVKLNPKQNRRRQALHLYSPGNCPHE